MDQPDDIAASEVGDDDLDEINAQLALADPSCAVPFNGVTLGDFDALEREFEQQLEQDTAHADSFVPTPPVAVPVVVMLGDFAAMEREFEAQLEQDIEHANNFVPAPGRVRIDCAWLIAANESRAVLSRFAAAAALAGSKQAEPTSSSQHSRDGQPPQQHAGPGGHSTPHVGLTPRLNDQDPARA